MAKRIGKRQLLKHAKEAEEIAILLIGKKKFSKIVNSIQVKNVMQGWTEYFPSVSITIPVFAFHRSYHYLTWYIAHELSHAIEIYPRGKAHGKRFYKILAKITPSVSEIAQRWLKYEKGYKPRNSLSYGKALGPKLSENEK